MIRKHAMCPILRMLLILWMCSEVCGAEESLKAEEEHGVEAIGEFVKDIIKTWRLISPTIVLQDDLLNLCMSRDWWLCLTNDMDVDELAIHLALIHNKTKQDGIILVGNQGHRQLLKRITNLAPSMFTSNLPVFMADEYIGEIQLRLDSNIIFYKELAPTKFKFFDKFRLSFGRWIYPQNAKNMQKKAEKNRSKIQIARIFTVDLGDWNMASGIILQKSMNRWDRRIDLKRAVFRNCMRINGNWAFLLWDQTKNHTRNDCYKCMNNNICKTKNGRNVEKFEIQKGCMISAGYFQEKLHYITESLNLQVKIVMDNGRKYWRYPKKLKYAGRIGFLRIRAADVVSNGVAASRSLSYHAQGTKKHGGIMTIPTNRHSPTLIAAKPKESHIQLLAYVRVFGITQWVVFISLLVGFVIVTTMTASAMNTDVKDGSILKMILSAIAIAYLFTLQLGTHKIGKHSRITTLLTLTLSMLTLLFWVHYCCDITAEMTTGPIPPIPVKNFEDVLEHGYKVITPNWYFASLLKNAKNGSAKQKVFTKYFYNQSTCWGVLGTCRGGNTGGTKSGGTQVAFENPKTLLYAPTSTWSDDKTVSNEIFNGLTLLKLDDSEKVNTHAALMLQHDSEFLQIFNHHIMKMIETGVLRRIYRKYNYRLYRNEQFSISEPQPLGINNALFLFILLGAGISMALGIAFVEYIVAKWHQMRVMRSMMWVLFSLLAAGIFVSLGMAFAEYMAATWHQYGEQL